MHSSKVPTRKSIHVQLSKDKTRYTFASRLQLGIVTFYTQCIYFSKFPYPPIVLYPYSLIYEYAIIVLDYKYVSCVKKMKSYFFSKFKYSIGYHNRIILQKSVEI